VTAAPELAGPAGPPDPAEPAAAPDEVPRARRRRVVAVGAVAAVLTAAAAVAAYAYDGDVPRGTRVLGVDVGGTSRSEAERTLHDRFDGRAGEPVTVNLAGRSLTVAPADIAMTLDVDATVGRAMKGGPALSGRTVPPVVRLDQGKLETLLRRRLPPGAVTLVKPGITYAGRTPRPSYPAAGRSLDPGGAAAAVRNAWLTGATATVGLPVRAPATGGEQVDALLSGLAEPAVAAPVTVWVGDRSFTLAEQDIAAGLVFRSDADGLLTPAIDAGRLHAAAAKQFATVETAPEQARFSLSGGKPHIVPGTPGERVDLTALGPALLAVLPDPAPREVGATLTRQEAGATDADLARLGVKEKVSTFTTYFTGGARSPRSQNIMTIARAVDGAVVKPGETFSLNGHTGERDYRAGYHDAPVIVDGKLEPGVAGGASQFTTTLFNAAYYAGLQDVEHKPHSFYFDRYPAVIESTIFYPTLDLRFKNTTPYGILVDTSTTSRSVTVSMWSTRYYDSVRTERGPRRDLTSPPTVHRDPGPSCIPSSGLPGFTQDAWRIIRKDGKEVTREKFTWRYDPEPRFICGGQP
jgi:vancomycin resistance protein YoaR